MTGQGAGQETAQASRHPGGGGAVVTGRHVLADFWCCDLPADEAAWRDLVGAAVGAMGANLLGVQVHTFDTGGTTVLALLSESHLSVHTWPEHDYVAIDAFTCGDAADPVAGVDALRRALRPARESVTVLRRGAVGGTGTA